MKYKAALVVAGLALIPFVFSSSPAKAVSTPSLICSASGTVADFRKVAASNAAVIHVEGAKHLGEIVMTSSELQIGQSVKLCTDGAGNRVIG